MEQSVEKRLKEIQDTFRAHGAVRAFLFGSAASGGFSEKSDVDFLFSFPEDMDYETYADNYFSLLQALRNLLNKEIDLVAEKTIKNPYLMDSINASKVRLL